MKADALNLPLRHALIFSVVALVACTIGAVSLYGISNVHENADLECKQLENKGYQATKSKNYAVAVQCYKNALVFAERSTDKQWKLPRLQTAIGDAYSLDHQFESAEQQYRQAVDSYLSITPSNTDERITIGHVHGELLGKIAYTLGEQGKINDAIAQYEVLLIGANDFQCSLFDKVRITKQYAELLRKTHHERDAAALEAGANLMDDYKGYFDSGVEDFSLGKYKQAQQQFELQLIGARKVHMPDLAARAMTYLAMCELMKNHVSEATSLCQKALVDCDAVQHLSTRHQRQAEALVVLAMCKELTGESKESAKLVDAAIGDDATFVFPTVMLMETNSIHSVKSSSLNDAVDAVAVVASRVFHVEELAIVDLHIGIHKKLKRDFKEARLRVLKAIDYYRAEKRANCACGVGFALAEMGNISSDEKKYKEAQEWYEKSIAQFEHAKVEYQITGPGEQTANTALRVIRYELMHALEKQGKMSEAKKIQASLDREKHS